MTVTNSLDTVDSYLKTERAEQARLARSYGLVVFNPDTDPDTCAMVLDLSDERLHADEDDMQREAMAEYLGRELETAAEHSGYVTDQSGGF